MNTPAEWPDIICVHSPGYHNRYMNVRRVASLGPPAAVCDEHSANELNVLTSHAGLRYHSSLQQSGGARALAAFAANSAEPERFDRARQFTRGVSQRKPVSYTHLRAHETDSYL